MKLSLASTSVCIFLFCTLFSCQHLPGFETNLSTTSDKSTEVYQPEPTEETVPEILPRDLSNASSATQADLSNAASVDDGEDGEDGEKGWVTICEDSIYGQYLKKTYFKSNKKYLRSKRKNYYGRLLDAQATQHAFDSIAKETPYTMEGLPLIINERVHLWLKHFKTKGKRTFLKWMARGAKYEKLIKTILKEEGVPPGFYYLAMVESGFNTRARSFRHATGPWQFMHGTARLFDLKINYWVDERRDPAKATRAAARYLRQLYSRFGDWYLAMAAYNAGPGKVNSAIRRSKSRDFWTIAKTRYLKPETKHYVPKTIAAMVIGQNLEAHGFSLNQNAVVEFPDHLVEVERPMRLKDVAEVVGTNIDKLKEWNPELSQKIIPPQKNNQTYKLRLPHELAHKFVYSKNKIAQIKIDDIKLHRIRKGETLLHIAGRYKVKVRSILALNPKLRPRALKIGKKIAVPIPHIVTRIPST